MEGSRKYLPPSYIQAISFALAYVEGISIREAVLGELIAKINLIPKKPTPRVFWRRSHRK